MGSPSRGFPSERANPWRILEDKVKGEAIETVNLKTHNKNLPKRHLNLSYSSWGLKEREFLYRSEFQVILKIMRLL